MTQQTPTISQSPELKLRAPGVGEEYVTPDFAEHVRLQIEQLQSYLSGVSDDIPPGFTQAGDAYLPYQEQFRDYYVEQLSVAMIGDTYVLDEALTSHEQNAGRAAKEAGEQQPHDAPPNAVTVNMLPFMKERLGWPDPEVTEQVPGSIVRSLKFDDASTGRALQMFELEVPRTTDAGTIMNRLLFFVKPQ